MPLSSARPYFVHPLVDGLFIGGLSLVLFLPMGAFDLAPTPERVLLLVLITNWPHFGATLARLYGSRETVRRYPGLSIALPVALAAVLPLGALFPRVAAPALLALGALVNVAHSAAQNYGIAIIYAERAGVPLDGADRRRLLWLLYAMWILFVMAHAELVFHDIPRLDRLHYPPWLARGTALALALFAISFLARVLPRWRRARSGGFPLFLLPLAGNAVWCLSAGTSLYYLLPLLHSIQNLFLAWVLHSREAGISRRSFREACAALGRWALAMAAWGAGAHLLARGVGSALHVGFAIAVVGITVHHFLAESVLWRVRAGGPAAALVG